MMLNFESKNDENNNIECFLREKNDLYREFIKNGMSECDAEYESEQMAWACIAIKK